MKKLKKMIAVLLLAAALLGLAACSGDEIYSTYRVIGTVGESSCAIAFRSGDKVKEFVTAAISELAADGTLSMISRRWFGEDMCPTTGDKEALESLEEEIPSRTFIAGVVAGSPGMCLLENGAYSGFDVDLAQSVCTLLGWELKIQPINEDDLEIELQAGNIDGAFSCPTASNGKVDVTEPYLKRSLVIVSRADTGAKNVRGLYDEAVAVKGENELNQLKDSGSNLYENIGVARICGDDSQCLEAIDSGLCAGALVDSTSVKYVLR